MIEVEKIVTFQTKDEQDQFLKQVIDLGAKDLGENNTENIFYLADTYQLKVSKMLSKNKAKIALKSRELGADSGKEIEIHFPLEDAASAESIIDTLIPDRSKIPTEQSRHDFLLDDIEIAVKYSQDWGYHVELEQMVSEEEDIEGALERIEALAKKLKVSTLTVDEAKARISKELSRRGIKH